MKRQLVGTAAALAAMLAAAAGLAAPAQADPPSGGETVVVMSMPGPRPPAIRGGPDAPAKPPAATLSVQYVDGSGVDRDGTEGVITGPLVNAQPQLRAGPAPEPGKIEPLPGI